MKGTPARRAISRSASAVSIACASLSMTHGPAMSASGPPPRLTPPTSTGDTTRLPYHGRRGRMPVRELVTMARFDESGEQRVRLERLRLELGMELHRHVIRMRWQLDHLDEISIERSSHDLESFLGDRFFVETVELETVAMTLFDDVAAIQLVRLGAGLQLARIRAEAHRPAEIVDTQQIAQLVDDVRLGVGRAFGGIRVSQPADVARVFDRGPLETVTDAEVGNLPLARDLRRTHHSARAAIAEAARHEDPVGAIEQLLAARLLERLGLDLAGVHFLPLLEAAVLHTFLAALL